MDLSQKVIQLVKLIFASNNAHKLQELRAALGPDLEIISLAESGIQKEIPEPFNSLKENAQVKAQTIYQLTRGKNCFSEDTGLEVDALNGEPGVHSARYAGEPVSPENNIRKLLRAMRGVSNRRARFTTVICLILEEKEFFFEGSCQGQILHSPAGTGGFGYDSVFLPDGSNKSFAEMNSEDKNIFSHRRRAGELMLDYLKTRVIR